MSSNVHLIKIINQLEAESIDEVVIKFKEGISTYNSYKAEVN